MNRKLLAASLFTVLGVVILPALQGCLPLVAAGVTTGVLATVDRRTVGAQTDDEAIELKAGSRVGEKLSGKGRFSFTSYNRKLLITGQAQSAEVKAEAERVATQVPNVELVHNELAIGPALSFSDQSNDAFITSKIKTRSVDNGSKFNPLHVKVVSEAGVAYLMGLVTQSEADAAINVARTTAGVKKVVNLFEIITPAKARELDVAQQSAPEKAK